VVALYLLPDVADVDVSRGHTGAISPHIMLLQ
jgi:hypothetical protein